MRTFALASWVLAVLLGLAGPASATAVFGMTWTSTTGTGTPGGTAIDAAPGDVLTADLVLLAGSEGVSGYGVSLRFDADLANELDLVTATEPAMVGGPVFPCSPYPTCFSQAPPQMTALSPGLAGTQESTASTAGFVFTYEAYTLSPGPVASDGPIVIGTVTFSVNTAVSDGADAQMGFYSGSDSVIDNDGNVCCIILDFVEFRGAAVNGVIPEPAVSALLGFGLLGLGLVARRARR